MRALIICFLFDLDRLPDINVNTDRLIIDDGDILTAGGLMAWIDLSLILIERFLGPTIMMEPRECFLLIRLAENKATTVPFLPVSTMVTMQS